RWADLFISDEAVQKSSQLIETRLEKLRDAGRLAMDRLAETGLYDSISARLGRARTGILDDIQSGRFDSAANRVGGNVDSILDNLGSAARALAQGLTGHIGADGAQQLGDAGDPYSENLKTLSAVLTTVGAGYGSTGRELSVVVNPTANDAGLTDNVNKRANQN